MFLKVMLRNFGLIFHQERREDGGGVAEEDFVKGVAVERLFGTYVDGMNAALVCDVDKAGGGIDRTRGSDDQKDGGVVELAVDGVHVEGNFPEPDDVRADGGAALLAGGESFGGFVESGIREGLIATGAA